MNNVHRAALSILVLLASASGTFAEPPVISPTAMFRGGAEHAGVYPPTPPALQGIQWFVPTDGFVTSSPAVEGQTVYIGTGAGKLLALDLRSGAEKWSAEVGSSVGSSPAVVANRVFFTSRDGTMHALSADTGKSLWEF